jgi:hypothetical protein
LNLCSFKVHVNNVKLYSESTELNSLYNVLKKKLLALLSSGIRSPCELRIPE